MYNPSTNTFDPPINTPDDNDDSEDYITKDKVVHHKGYDTHTIQKVPKPPSKEEQHSTDVATFLSISLAVITVVVIGIGTLISTLVARHREKKGDWFWN